MATALPVISLAATLVGTGLAVAGQRQQASAAREQANFQSAVARNNAILAQRRAEEIRDIGRADEAIARIQTAQLQARQRAVFAGNNVLLDDGSPLDIFEDTALIGELDALTIRDRAEREALATEAAGVNFTAESQLAGARARNTDAGLEIAGTVLTGVGSVAQKWYNFKRGGVDIFAPFKTSSRPTSPFGARDLDF